MLKTKRQGRPLESCESEYIGDTHEDEIESIRNNAIVVADEINNDSAVVEESLPAAPAQLDRAVGHHGAGGDYTLGPTCGA